jgi:hypothetical protein
MNATDNCQLVKKNTDSQYVFIQQTVTWFDREHIDCYLKLHYGEHYAIGIQYETSWK